MKKYFLIIFGDLESEENCREIALTLTPIVDSPHLKFNHTKGSLIFHFASEVSQEEIHDYVLGSLFDVCSSFILTENTDKVSFYLPKKVEEHLMDLENEGKNVELKITMEPLNSLNSDSEDNEEFVALLLDEIKKKVKKPKLDQILDKINSTGFDSLSQFEKDTLDEYSKSKV